MRRTEDVKIAASEEESSFNDFTALTLLLSPSAFSPVKSIEHLARETADGQNGFEDKQITSS